MSSSLGRLVLPKHHPLVPGHGRVEGNEQADLWARGAAVEGSAAILGEATTSLASLRRQRTVKADQAWTEDIIRRNHGRRTFSPPAEGAKPGIRDGLRRAPKGVASRFLQLVCGYALTAPFLNERLGWTESDVCWWCGSGKQTREHLLKERIPWRKEIRTLWKEVGLAGESGKEKGPVRVGKERRVLGISSKLKAERDRAIPL